MKPPVQSNRKTTVIVALILGLITLLLYLPALRQNFLEYDDQQYVTENARVQAGLTWNGFLWAFGFHASNWHPLTWLSHMLDCQLYGLNPIGHHLTNILLHAASTALLFSLFLRMTGAMWRSAAVAALFAWHPLHVESVAWIAERKDVLCAFFWMTTLLFYARYAANPAATRYCVTLVSFALCLMSKPMGITLPFVLLLLDYWPLGRIADCGLRIADFEDAERPKGKSALKLILEKIPFFILSGASAFLTLKAQEQAMVSTRGLSVGERIAHAFTAYFHYIRAAFFPYGLAVYYPYQKALPMALIVVAVAVIGGITVLVIKFARRRPYFVTGWFWYLGTLIPVIGLVQVGDQAWADRYTYLPLIGLSVCVVWGTAELITNKLILRITTVAAGAAMIAMTFVQLSYWKSTRTLFEHAAQVTHENFLAITVLGSVLANDGKLDEAMNYYQKALKYKPGFPEAYFFMGNALEKQGRLDEAIAAYQNALWFKPIQEQTHIFLGMVLGRQLKYDEAIAHYEAALQENPDSAVAHNNLARIFHTQGRLDEAIEHYRAALQLDPKLALAHNNLGILMLQKGNLDEGIRQLHEAQRLKPDNVETEYNLALALNQKGEWAEAAELFKKAVGPSSTDAQAQYEFATALAHLQKSREAMSHYASALILRPDFPEALDGLSWILATDPNADFRNGAEAVKMSERACELSGRKSPDKLKTLAAAYAEAGRFEEAAKTAKSAEELALADKRQELADECKRMGQAFQSSKPWREMSGK